MPNESSERFLQLPDGTWSRASETTEVFTVTSSQGASSPIIEIRPGQPHTIATGSLAGCNSVALIGRDAEGGSLLHMNYFPPLLEERQKRDLASISHRFASLFQTSTKVTALVAVPGDWQKNSEGRYEMVPKNPARVQELSNAALSGFGDGSASVDVRVLPYRDIAQRGGHDGFIITVPASADKPIRYDLYSRTYGSVDASHISVERSTNSAANPR
ncbi:MULTISPECIES: hypothetical protein [unclassified Neorhizobium]|uniref:hypothetical protein n=1 Tax=unclassified Neorhizobium TaxID=2629175 RepID=UPI001FF4832B|nr:MULTISPECIES: hypothetical protein [unclassified Neorhizobium]MCJ9669441.1 hypothetical protein [Neorhizobium sp. SHOUNA12B]MCJ9745534.1 hypothetical protein [Neorhizobium sp. SHOUNA12A]